MSHRYPTRFQSKTAQNQPVPCYDEDKPSEEEVRVESFYNHQKEQEQLLSSLVPSEIEQAVYAILVDQHNGKILLTDPELREANQIWDIITKLKSNQLRPKMFSYHYPIMCRLQANIDLFTYIKYNYELVRRFNYIANIYHNYYAYFSNLYNKLWNQFMDSTLSNYKDSNNQYCTLLAVLKDIIHNGEMVFINQHLLKYY